MGVDDRTVAGWVLEERLGVGAFGEVWKARRRHVELFRALKLVRIGSEREFGGWRHEIARLEALSHPNIVRFYDADIVTEEGPYQDYAWIATELCERSLKDELAQRRNGVMPAEDVTQMLEDVLAALAAAHEDGSVHRDIKPANILLHEKGSWKLCDFGTARLVAEGESHPRTMVVGTSPYMSAAAHRGRQDYAADLYALGVTLHEALCGKRLHERPNGMTDSEYVKLILDTPPTIWPGLPQEWQTAVHSLINAEGRNETAGKLRDWFRETRGTSPPPAQMGPTPGGAGTATAATAAASTPGTAATSATKVVTPDAGKRGDSPPGSGTPAGTGPTHHLNRGGQGASPDQAPRPSQPQRAFVPAPPEPASPRTAWLTPKVGPPGSSGQAAPYSSQPGSGYGHQAPYQGWPPSPGSSSAGRSLELTRLFWQRVVAFVIDCAVIYLLTVPIFAITMTIMLTSSYDQVDAGTVGPDPSAYCENTSQQQGFGACEVFNGDVYVRDEPVWTRIQVQMGAVLIPTFFIAVVQQGQRGSTPGKLVLGLRTVGRHGRPPGIGRALVRTLLLVVDAFPWVFPVVGLLTSAASTPTHRRVGDRIAGTYVIRKR